MDAKALQNDLKRLNFTPGLTKSEIKKEVERQKIGWETKSLISQGNW